MQRMQKRLTYRRAYRTMQRLKSLA